MKGETTMIICMNYTDDGTRYIARIEYVSSRYDQDDLAIAQQYTERYDEVYIIPFVPSQELINEVVLNGCRI